MQNDRHLATSQVYVQFVFELLFTSEQMEAWIVENNSIAFVVKVRQK